MTFCTVNNRKILHVFLFILQFRKNKRLAGRTGNQGAGSKINGSHANSRSGRRMMEDNLAKIFGFIVGVFMVCHTPRLLLGLHEAWITPNVIACNKASRRAFPMWAVMFGHISHVMMAINSSVNCIIYGLISPQFRKAMKKKARKWGCYIRRTTRAPRPRVILERILPHNSPLEVRSIQSLPMPKIEVNSSEENNGDKTTSTILRAHSELNVTSGTWTMVTRV